MSILKILKEPDPILRKKSAPVASVNKQIKKTFFWTKFLN